MKLRLFKRTLSILLSITLIMGLFISVGVTASAADTSDSSDNELIFSVPEAIYLEPSITGYTTQTSYNFQWFVDSQINPDTHELTLRTGENDTGNIIFYYPTAKEAQLSCRYLNRDGSEMEMPPAFYDEYDANTNYAPGARNMEFTDGRDCYVKNTGYSDVYIRCNNMKDGLACLELSTESLGPTMAASESGCFIEWTMSFVDETDSKTYEAKAYTYVYKPMVQAAGVGVRCMNAFYDDLYNSQLAWISGIHSIENTGNFYPRSNGGDGAFIPFSSTGKTGFCPAGSSLNFQFGGSNPTDGSKYMDWATSNNNPKHWLTGDGNGVFSIKSFQYSSDKDFNSSNPIGPFGAMVTELSPLASFRVDSSRYRNFNQIPNLSIGMMVTDDEGSEYGVARFADWHEYPDGLDVNDAEKPANTVSGIYLNYSSEVISYAGTAAIFDTSSKSYTGIPYQDSLMYNGKWSKDFSRTGSKTGRYDLVSSCTNRDTREQGGDCAATFGRIRIAVYMSDKTALRDAVNTVINSSVKLGMNPDGSYTHSKNSANWKTLMETYEGASRMLTAVDYMPDITVNGKTYSDPNSMAAALNRALTDVLAESVPVQMPGVQKGFEDVPDTAYYAQAVDWAVENEITNGTNATHFSPDVTCTRAQTVTFLWRAAGSPKVTSEDPFTDVSGDAYYYDAVLWAVENGITKGTSATAFSPDATVTRGQVVTFQNRAAKAETPASIDNPFTDVAEGAYYYDAVLWAVENEITNGTTASTFSPDKGCTRGQIVTFLFRAQ